MRLVAALILSALFLSGCETMKFASAAASNTPPPPLAETRDGGGATPEYATAVALHRFPVGTAETAMIAELERQRFTVDQPTVPGHGRAVATWGGVPCRYWYTLTWRIDPDGKLTGLNAKYDSGCL